MSIVILTLISSIYQLLDKLNDTFQGSHKNIFLQNEIIQKLLPHTPENFCQSTSP